MIDRRQVIAVAAAAAAAGPALGADARRSRGAFPPGFLWGASTAGHQIEGNNVASDMWFVENRKPTFYPDPSTPDQTWTCGTERGK